MRQKARQKPNDMYRRLFESVPVGYFILDSSGIIEEVNLAGADMLGLTVSELLKTQFADLVAAESRPDFLRHMAEVKNNPSLSACEMCLQRKDGTQFYSQMRCSPVLTGQGQIAQHRVAIFDISDRKRMEKALQQSQQQLEGVFQNMAEGVVLLDISGRVVKINEAAARILGLSREQIEGTFYDSPLWMGKVELADGTVLSRSELGLSQILGHEEGFINQEAHMKLPDGTVRWLRGSITPLLDAGHQVTGVITTFADITAEKMQQEHLTRRLLEAQEEERKRIARELHDDTAQSISAISLELDSLTSARACSEEVTGRLQNLKASTDRTMEDIRRYSHELHPALLDHLGLPAALEQLVGEMRERAGPEVYLNIEGQKRKVKEDLELALFRIAQESLNNAWKHAEASLVKIALQYFPDKIYLEVADNGKGFKVWKESAAALKRGSLGLLSMKERANIIGTELKIESKPDQGTRISLEVKG